MRLKRLSRNLLSMSNIGIRQHIASVDLLQAEFREGIPESQRRAFLARLEVTELLLHHGRRFARDRNAVDMLNRATGRVEHMRTVLRKGDTSIR